MLNMSFRTKLKHPVGIQWKIPEAQLQEKRNSIDGYLQSTVFPIASAHVKYFIVIFPEHHGETWICFHLDFNIHKEIEADYTVSIESANFSHNFQKIFDRNTNGEGWGFKLCDTEEFFDPINRYIVDGEMIINLGGVLAIEENVPAKLNQLSGDADSVCVNLWLQDDMDFAIFADGRKITAHKCVLSMHSPVFAAMFKPHTQEAQQNQVTIPDFPFNIVETAIKLCYHHSLVANIPIEDMILLFQFYDKYDIQSLKDKIEEYLISEIDESNVCRLINSSIISNAAALQKECSEFLRLCLKKKPVADFDVLDRDFALNFLKTSFYLRSG